jgi:hypothetical protein
LEELAKLAGADDPAGLALHLHVIVEGAVVDGPVSAASIRTLANAVLAASLA